ncbi:unnamed protein product [Heterosigma akashiwo]
MNHSNMVRATVALLMLLQCCLSFAFQTPSMSLGRAAPCDTPESFKKTYEKAMEGVEGFKKKISLLGSTGSIGTQTLDICEEKPEHFEVVGLSAGGNVQLLAKQIQQFKPKVASVSTADLIPALKEELSVGGEGGGLPEMGAGQRGICAVAAAQDADTVVTGIVGCAGLLPTIEAIKAGKTIALANKETLIAGGPIILPLLEEHGVDMIPADSEHSAIFQSLQGFPPGALRRIILTASGGAFRDWAVEDMHKATVKDALTHPNWDMGAKITVDSATMMNKGLEVIEAHYLFGTAYDDIDVVIHPQSIIHSAVESQDTSVIAQLGWPDMRLPLLYSVSWPHRIRMSYEQLDLVKLGSMTFKAPDTQKYPCLDLASPARPPGGSMTACLNSPMSGRIEIFRKKEQIGFLDIPKVIEVAGGGPQGRFQDQPDPGRYPGSGHLGPGAG